MSEIQPNDATDVSQGPSVVKTTETSSGDAKNTRFPPARTTPIESSPSLTSADPLEVRAVSITETSHPQSELLARTQRARASALMDPVAVRYLGLFVSKYPSLISVEDISKCVDRTEDWLKIAGLIRADYIETLGSTVRVTQEGLSAWDTLQKVAKRGQTP